MPKAYAVLLPFLLVWLALSLFLGWGAVQDDSFIHLRYAANLARYHFITYDGVHANYGVSSLLFVSILGVLRQFTQSPDLAHAVSTFFHLVVFVVLAAALLRKVAASSSVASGLGIILLLLLCTPSAIRWMDDGMETGLTIGMTCLLAWLIHAGQEVSVGGRSSSRRMGLLLFGFAFLAVLLRVELLQLCLFGTLIFLSKRFHVPPSKGKEGDGLRPTFSQQICTWFFEILPLAAGAALAVGVILAVMHSPLPDTALAKMHGMGHWRNSLRDTVSTLAGAMSFGAGLALFWLVTLIVLVSCAGKLTTESVLANVLFPILLTVSLLRGQEIQGVRYFAWTFFFSAVWNILELSELPDPSRAGLRERAVIFAFLAVLVVELPFEAVFMRRVLTQRAATLEAFELKHLEALRAMHGVASDIGFIGYFTGAGICDLAGLVNGRLAAQRTSEQRAEHCAASDPDFLFVNTSQLEALNQYRDFSLWQVCGRYDFTNITTQDSHFLIARPRVAGKVCGATGESPYPSSSLFATRPSPLTAAALTSGGALH